MTYTTVATNKRTGERTPATYAGKAFRSLPATANRPAFHTDHIGAVEGHGELACGARFSGAIGDCTRSVDHRDGEHQNGATGETFREDDAAPEPAPTDAPVLVTVTIGRNVPADHSPFEALGNAPRPMSEDRWNRFHTDIAGVLHLIPSEAVFGPFTGVGEWEGVSEESITYTALVPLPAGTDVEDWSSVLGDILGGYAKRYGQDAIAYAVGPARLATA